VIARVVAKRDDARVASFVTAAAAIFLLLVLADDAMHLALFRTPADSMFLTVAVAMALAGVGPWLAWSRRSGRAVRLRCGDGVIEAGRLRIAARDVRAISVAHAAKGSSVAIKHGKRVAFLEVERDEDTARIVETLAAGQSRTCDVVVLPRSGAIAVIQMLVTLAALIVAPLYYMAAMRFDVADGATADPKALFGLVGVLAAVLSFIFLVMRQLWPNQAVAFGMRGGWETHAALHRERARVRGETEGEEGAREPVATIEKVRIGGLERGDEEVGAWLARIDAIPTEQHAYRGDALKRDVLWEALGDAGAPVDTRMAAARVLRRRYGEEERALVRAVADADVRLRIEAALDEHDDAERRIERLGPLFRAR
jgi:hypothetical protein